MVEDVTEFAYAFEPDGGLWVVGAMLLPPATRDHLLCAAGFKAVP